MVHPPVAGLIALTLLGVVQIGVAVWVASDASRRRMNSYFWLFAVLVFSVLGFLLYLVLRKPILQTEEENRKAGTEHLWPRVKRGLSLVVAALGIIIAWAVADEFYTQWQIKNAPKVEISDVGTHCDKYVVVHGWVNLGHASPHLYMVQDPNISGVMAGAHLPVMAPVSQATPNDSDYVEVLGKVACKEVGMSEQVLGLFQESVRSAPIPPDRR
jgi:hypothetical protein